MTTALYTNCTILYVKSPVNSTPCTALHHVQPYTVWSPVHSLHPNYILYSIDYTVYIPVQQPTTSTGLLHDLYNVYTPVQQTQTCIRCAAVARPYNTTTLCTVLNADYSPVHR